MKGMLDFLERAGLVRLDTPEVAPVVAADAANLAPVEPGLTLPEASPSTDIDASGVALAHASPSAGAPLDLEAIYANQGIAPSFYPAERLLRLIDGLSAMDEATRLMAIRAMDAADESWTIADPLADAAAKARALAAHGAQLQSDLQQLERQTQEQLDAISQRQEQVLGGISKQMSELESLVAREKARAEKESSAQQTQLKAAQERTASALAELTQVTQRLQSLVTQFGARATAKE